MRDVTFIRSISIGEVALVARRGHFRAVVVMTTDDSTLSLIARHDCGSDAPPRDLHDGLISDALRQLHRLPEYRTGQRHLILSPDTSQGRRQSA